MCDVDMCMCQNLTPVDFLTDVQRDECNETAVNWVRRVWRPAADIGGKLGIAKQVAHLKPVAGGGGVSAPAWAR